MEHQKVLRFDEDILLLELRIVRVGFDDLAIDAVLGLASSGDAAVENEENVIRELRLRLYRSITHVRWYFHSRAFVSR